jgi:hypothetical protein
LVLPINAARKQQEIVERILAQCGQNYYEVVTFQGNFSNIEKF